VVGDVEIGADSSVWYGSLVRGDVQRVRIGARTNLQDHCVVHVTRDRFPCEIGDEVTVGHRAVVHGCRVGDEGGRFPANLIHDGSEDVVGLFPETASGMMKAGTQRQNTSGWAGAMPDETGVETYGDSGSASRFFYCAKADASERRNSKHPTVKPVALMRYLVRLVCPAGGVVLDPFAGSGTTIEAARLEHCRAIGIEREAEYCADILERLRQGVLF